jgi:hypothetical protein
MTNYVFIANSLDARARADLNQLHCGDVTLNPLFYRIFYHRISLAIPVNCE